MHLSTLFGLGLLSALPFVHGAAHQHRRHTFQARSPSFNETETHSLEKRAFENARYTFYDVGLGACGKNNVASDFIVALNSPQFGGGYPGPNCFKSITVQVGGKQTGATIMDECPGCPYGGLDMSRGLFTFFAPESEGVITGSWWFNDGGDSAPKPAAQPPKTTKTPDPTTPAWTPPATSTPVWTPPTTSEEPKSTPPPPPPPSTSSEAKETPTSTQESSSSVSSSAPPSSSSSVESSSEVPTSSATSSSASATPTLSQAGSIQAAEQALLNIVGLFAAGANAN